MIASVISLEEGMTRTNINTALKRALPCIHPIIFVTPGYLWHCEAPICWGNPAPTHTEQGLCSVQHQCVFKNYGGNRYLHFVPDSALRDAGGRAPLDCWRSASWSCFFVPEYTWNHTSTIFQSCTGHSICALAVISQTRLGPNSSVLMGQVPGTLPLLRRYAAMLLLFALSGHKAQIISWGGGHCLKSPGCQLGRGELLLGHLAKNWGCMMI